MKETIIDKAGRYLSDNRLLILEVAVDRIAALCRGDTGLYSLGSAGAEWCCDCPARSRRFSHIEALQLVTVADVRHLRQRAAKESHHVALLIPVGSPNST
jgi:hypothetical protein